MTLSLTIKDSTLNQMFKRVKEYCRVLLPYTYVYGYKNHGFEHAEDVVQTLEKILSCFSAYWDALDEKSKFILLSACYLHDIGMIKRNDEPFSKTKQIHNDRSRNYIDKYATTIGIDEKYIRAIQEVSYAHSDFKDERNNYVTTLSNDNPEHLTIRDENRELAALLRISNLFALRINQKNRIPQSIFFQVKDKNKIKWLMRSKISDISFSKDGTVSIDINWNVDHSANCLDVYQVYLRIKDLIKRLQDRLDKCKKYLPASITLHRINCNLGDFKRSLTLHEQKNNLKHEVIKSIQKGSSWLLTQRDKAWGKSKETRPRVSNSAKTIVSLLDNKNQAFQCPQNEIKETFDWIFQKYDPNIGGFTAKTLKEYSTSAIHCTAMVIYAYGIVFEKDLTSIIEAAKYKDYIIRSIKWLIDVKDENGWGNWNGQTARPLCSFWALRALKKIQPFIRSDLKLKLDYKEEIITFKKVFLINTKKNSSIICFLLILIHEILNENEKKELTATIKELINRLFYLRNGSEYWNDEIEEYIVERNEEKGIWELYEWTHHINALAIFAIATHNMFLTKDQKEILFESILSLINAQDDSGYHAFFKSRSLNTVIPTYEALNTLNKCLDLLFNE